MGILIILNIILIVLLIILIIYLFSKKYNFKYFFKKVNVSNDNINNDVNKDVDKSKENKHHVQNKKIKKERVFIGRFVDDVEYQQLMKNKRSDISILLEELDNEYEHFKELSK